MADDGDGPATPQPPPPPVPITAPTWVMVVGAVAGLLTLLGFFFFAYMSATNPEFACNSFTFLAPIFAFGVALAVSFIGGSAAISGQFGLSAQRHAFAYSAGGGISVFFIAFLLFQQFQPQGCDGREATLKLSNMKQGAIVAALGDVWQRREDNMSNASFNMRYLIKSAEGEGIIEVLPANGGEGCSVHVLFVADLDTPTGAQVNFKVQRSKGNGREVTLHYTLKDSDNPAKAVSSCFKIDGAPLVGYLALSPHEPGAVFGLSPSVPSGSEGEVASIPDMLGALGSVFVGAVQAQDAAVSFSAISSQLSGPDPTARVSARQYLSENFSAFEPEIVAEIMNPNAPGGDYLAGMLSALISGIDVATEGKLAPGTARNLSQPLPFIAGKEARIIELTAHEDASVRKQARRLIQRFPMDAFAAIYAPLVTQAAEGNCNVSPAATDSEAIIYSSIFFTYNRIIQTAVPGLSKEDAETAESIATQTIKAADCLELDLRVDGALVLFGLSTIYGESGYPTEAKQRAVDFLDTVEKNGGSETYYFQTHVDLMLEARG